LAAVSLGWIFAHVSFLLPLKRVYTSQRLLAFHHPQPSYPLHIIIVPKKALRNLAAVQPSDASLLLEILKTTQHIAENMKLENWRLIVNAGAYQEVPHLHFHMIQKSGDQESIPRRIT
jgi:histidine triad (HIT) family protein